MDTNSNYKGIDFVDFSSLLDEEAKSLFDVIFPNFQYGEIEFPWRENSRQSTENCSPEKFSVNNNNNNDTTNNNTGATEQQPATPIRQRTFSDSLSVSTPQSYTSGSTLDMSTKTPVPPAPFLASGSTRSLSHNISQFTQQAPPITFYGPRPPFPVVTSAYALHGQELITLHPHQQPHNYSETSVYELQPESDPSQTVLEHQHHPKYRSDSKYPMRKPKKTYYDPLYSHADEVMQTMMDSSVDPLTNQATLPASVVPFSNHFPPGISATTGYPMQYTIHGYVPYVPYTGYIPQPGPLVEMPQSSADVVPFEPPIVIPQHPPPTIPPVSSQVSISRVTAPELPQPQLQQRPEEVCATDVASSIRELEVESCEDKQWSPEEPPTAIEDHCDVEIEGCLEDSVAAIEISDIKESSLESLQEDVVVPEISSPQDATSTEDAQPEAEPASAASTAKTEQTENTSSVAPVVATAPVVTSAWGSRKSWAGLFKSEGAPVPEPMPCKIQESLDAQSGDEESVSEDLESDCLLHRLGKFVQRLKLDFTTRPFQPRGLINRSNWCYINATLQALLVCPALYNMLRQLQDIVCQRNKSSTPIMDSLVELVSEFTPLNNVSKRKEDLTIGPPLEPTCIHKMLTLIKSECIKGRQEDAEEFLSCILNGLHEEMVSLTKATTTLNNGTCNGDLQTNGRVDGSEEDDEEDSWKVMGAKNKGMVTRSDQASGSLVKDLFGGQTRSVLTAGSECSAVLQPFFTLQLDIQTNGESVAESLSQLTVKEPIHGYQCPKSKKEVEACRRTTLEELPPVLILHFKRFVYDDKDGGSKKVLKRIDYPLELELKTDLLSPEVRKKYIAKQSRSYKLFAVVYHDGKEAVKGHYIADIFYPGSGSWLRCDDRNIVPTKEAQVLAFNSPCVPYLLFYSRTDLQQQQQHDQAAPASK